MSALLLVACVLIAALLRYIAPSMTWGQTIAFVVMQGVLIGVLWVVVGRR